jgi:NhaP-type Na+/H+ or K+/H+ antiporter
MVALFGASAPDCTCLNTNSLGLIVGSVVLGVLIGLIARRVYLSKKTPRIGASAALFLLGFAIWRPDRAFAQTSVEDIPDRYFECYCPTLMENLQENWVVLILILALAFTATLVIAHLFTKLRS